MQKLWLHPNTPHPQEGMTTRGPWNGNSCVEKQSWSHNKVPKAL